MPVVSWIVAGQEKIKGITIRPRGGLGNQLFIYAAGRTIAMKYDVPLLIDPVWFRGQTKRKFELVPLFDQSMSVRMKTPNPLLNQLTGALGYGVLQLNEFVLSKRASVFVENSFRFDSKVTRVPRDATLLGYFQSYKYFASIAGTLSSELRSATSKVSHFQSSFCNRQSRDLPRIAVHVRRGDYQFSKESLHHGVLGLNYYRQAIQIMRQEIGDFIAIVFSDDIKSATAMLDEIHNRVETVNTLSAPSAWDDLSTMCQLDGIITANSSFSWWAAWLLSAEGMPCLVPDPWFRNKELDATDLLPPGWRKVPHQWLPLAH